jgi:hypothetical protein
MSFFSRQELTMLPQVELFVLKPTPTFLEVAEKNCIGLSITIKDHLKTSQLSPAALAALFKGGRSST